MSRLEMIDGGNWKDLLAAPVAVLMLAKSGCAACAAWTEELSARLADAGFWPEVRFGKMVLDQRGLTEFKRQNGAWLAEVHDLPTNVLYVAGERVKQFAGGGLERLEGRLRGLAAR
jgi:hypothetical protein